MFFGGEKGDGEGCIVAASNDVQHAIHLLQRRSIAPVAKRILICGNAAASDSVEEEFLKESIFHAFTCSSFLGDPATTDRHRSTDLRDANRM